jgi:SAM-dependent methyltransferase
MAEHSIDERNAEFWGELCGSGLARAIGIDDASPSSLARFDRAYFELYPYLAPYVTREDLRGRKVLEIGLGYGTLGQLIAEHGADYFGLDIADGPVSMMRRRLIRLDHGDARQVQQGSALDIPHEDNFFDFVYSIGCLHHTGGLPRAIAEVHRVLRPRGTAVIMLYHRHSFRQLVQVPAARLRRLAALCLGQRGHRDVREMVRAMYDTNASGDAAPCTEYVSRRDVRRLFRHFAHVRVDIRNFDTLACCKGRIVIPRARLLNNAARILGLDLYVVATK